MVQKSKTKNKTRKFEGYVALSLDEIMNLGSSSKSIGDLFLERIRSPKLDKSLQEVWVNDQFQYAVIGATVNQDVLISLTGVVEQIPVPVKKSKKSTTKKVVEEPAPKGKAKSTKSKSTDAKSTKNTKKVK